MNTNYDSGYLGVVNPFDQILIDDPVIPPTEKRVPFCQLPGADLKGRVFPDYQHNNFILPEVPLNIGNPFLYKSLVEEANSSYLSAQLDLNFLKQYPSLVDTHKNIATLQELEANAKAGVIAPVLNTLTKVFEFLKTGLDYLIFAVASIVIGGAAAVPVVGTTPLLTFGLPILGGLTALRLVCQVAVDAFQSLYDQWTTYHYQGSMKLQMGHLTDLKVWLKIDRFELIEKRIHKAFNDLEAVQERDQCFNATRHQQMLELKIGLNQVEMFRGIERRLNIKNEMPLLDHLLQSMP